MSVHPVPVTSPQKVAETENFAKQSCQIHFRDATATTAAALLGEAKPSHVYTTQFRVSSPLQSRSQAVVCVSTPRKYPRSGYFLVNIIHVQTERSTDVYFGMYDANKLRQEYPCEISSVPKNYRKVGLGWFFQKNGPYTKLINHHLKKVCLR